MKIGLILNGKSESEWLRKGLDLYFERIRRYAPFEVKVIPELKNAKNLPVQVQKDKEGELILAQVEGKKEVWLLDEHGLEFTSRELAGFLEKKLLAGCREIIFVIGGPYGFSEKMEKMAAGKISLSKLTFSHQMVRLLFAEQLYRAFTILRNEPYHHD